MENENKQIKSSSWALGILFVLSAVVLVLFYGFGYGEREELNGSSLVAPHYTGVLLVWMYALVAICIGTILIFGVAAAFRNMRTKVKGQKRTSFAAIIFLLTFIIVGASYFIASTEPVLLGDGKTRVTDILDLKLSDVCLYSIYALLLISVFCSILSMLGVFKSKK